MKLVIAVKRTERDNCPANWQDQIEQTVGVVVKSRTARYMSITATQYAKDAITAVLGHYLHIEPEIFYKPQI